MQGNDEERGERTTKAAGSPDKALGPGMFAEGEPAGDDPGSVGVSTGFPGSKKEADTEQGPEAGGGTGECGEAGPPQDDAGENAALAEAVAHRPGRDFEQAIGEDKGTEDPAELIGGDIELVLDAGGGHRDADAIEECDDRQ